MKTLAKLFATVCMLTGAFASIEGRAADNLVPDPGFKKADFSVPQEDSSWLWYQIVGPSEAKLVAKSGAVSMTGGKTFLHSSRFPVTAGKEYLAGITAKGTGKISVEFLWWDENGRMTDPHRTIAIEPVQLKEADAKVEGASTAPEGAVEAYIRIVAEEGTVTAQYPQVVAR